MIPVYQTKFGKPDGNCWEACIASIIECDISDMPYVRGQDPDKDAERVSAVLEFLASRNWTIAEFKLSDELGIITNRVPSDYYILCGLVECGIGHTVVAKGNEIIHNPNAAGRDSYAKLVKATAYQILFRVADLDILPIG